MGGTLEREGTGAPNLYILPEFDILAGELSGKGMVPSLADMEDAFKFLEIRNGSKAPSPMYVSARRDFDDLVARQAVEEVDLRARRAGLDLLAECRKRQKRTDGFRKEGKEDQFGADDHGDRGR